MKTMQCQHGCCGEGVDQHCCDPEEEEEGFNRYVWLFMRGSRGGGGGRGQVSAPLENHRNKGLLGNTGPDPLENHKATKPAFNVEP